MHWTPVYKFCTPCQFSLNTLIYYETIKDDSNYVLHKNGIYNITGMFPIKNKSKKLNTSYKYYVAQLPKDSFQDILKLYELDFMLFNYKMPYYEDFIPFRKIQSLYEFSNINNLTKISFHSIMTFFTISIILTLELVTHYHQISLSLYKISRLHITVYHYTLLHTTNISLIRMLTCVTIY